MPDAADRAVPSDVPPGVDALFAVEPERFVAERNALVRRLRAEKERELAARVAAWRRPSPAEWALNVVAREQPGLVERLVAATLEVRAAQAAAVTGAPGTDLRTVTTERRQATAEVTRAAAAVLSRAGRNPETVAPAIAALLARSGTSAILLEQLRVGRLGSGAADDDDLFEGLEPPPGTAARAASRPGRPSARERAVASVPSPDVVTAPKRPTSDFALARARRTVAEAERALARADRALTAARQTEREAENRWRDARRQAEEAEATRAGAAEQLERAERELRAADETG